MSSNKQATQPLRGAPCKLQVSLRVRTECGCETPAICPAQAHKESEDWNGQDERTLLWLDPRVPEKFRRRPKPLPFPAGLGSPPPLAAAPHLPALFRTLRSAWASGRWRGLGWAPLDWGSVPRPVSLRRQWGGAAGPPEAARERWGPLQTPTTSRCEWFTVTKRNAASRVRTKPKLTGKKITSFHQFQTPPQ